MRKSFLAGMLNATRHWKMVLLLLVANLLAAIPIVAPIFATIVMTTSGTATADALLADKLDVIWLADLFNNRFAGFSLESLGAQTGLLLLALGLGYLILNTLFAGGILEVLQAPDGAFGMRRFWAGCGAWFGRFTRLLLLSLFVYGAALFLHGRLAALVNAGEEKAHAYAPFAWRKWALTALLLALLAFINMVFDYAKIGTVVNDRHGMFQEALRAFRFAGRHFFSTYGLYILAGLTGLAVFALPVWLRSRIPQSSMGAVFLAFLLGQLAIGARMWARVMLYGAELHYFRRHMPAPPPEYEFARASEPYEFAPAIPAPPREEDVPAPQPEQES
ncbi:MAG: hypothetical protein SF339_08865 [Blastocatellia bacterium]|nr:hypothetical protein [Blastocatellia bacterium]